MATYRSILVRDDTLLGFCFAVGDDFGFDPVFLRILFAIVLFWSPAAAFGGYAVLGAIVLFSRWIAPDPVSAAAAAADSRDCPGEQCEQLPLAA
jgi:phage shock protein PspC (stress-responsive transcriptional regulator)